MSQKKNPKRILDNETISKGRNIRTSPQKLNLVAQSIRGLEASKAIATLSFSSTKSFKLAEFTGFKILFRISL